jgi:hypothetical protein
MDRNLVNALLRSTVSVIDTLRSADERTRCSQQHFIVNLGRLAGVTEALSPEIMIEVCNYIHNEDVEELLFIEQQYLAAIYGDDSLNLTICSIEVFI